MMLSGTAAQAFSATLRSLRLERGYTQLELADLEVQV
jgi:hypothetical protein